MTFSNTAKSPLSLLEAVEAIKNWRALLLLFGTVLCAGLCVYVFGSSGSLGLIIMGVLLGWAIVFYGFNAVGIMLFDFANSGLRTSAMNAVVRSLCTSHRLLGVLLIAGLIFLATLLAMALLLQTGKIPGVGPAFSFFFTPLSAVVLGLLFFMLANVLLPFASVAVWSGETVMSAIANLFAIARQRLFPVVLQQILLWFMAGAVGFMLVGILLTGTGFTIAVAPSLLDLSGRGMGGFGGMDGMGGMGGMGGLGGMGLLGLLMGGSMPSLAAGGSGLALAFALVLVLPGLIIIQGMCLIYLSAIEGLDLKNAASALQGGISQVKGKFENAQRAAQAAAEAARQNARHNAQQQQPQPPVQQAQTPAARFCPDCGAPLAEDDQFCGGCGRKTGA